METDDELLTFLGNLADAKRKINLEVQEPQPRTHRIITGKSRNHILKLQKIEQ